MTDYTHEGGGLRAVASGDDTQGAIWTDLEAPDVQMLEHLSARVGVSLPTREDQDEIEQSSRLYLDGGVPVMTVLLPARSEAGEMEVGPVSFVLLAERLITLRHHAPRPFTSFPGKAARASHGCATPEAVLMGLVEEIIDRLADITEQTGHEIDGVARRIFGPGNMRTEDYRAAMREIGRAEGHVMHLRESLMTMERMLGFLGPVMDGRRAGKPLRGLVKSQYRDARTITEQAGYLQQKITFMLDAALGLINIEQNAIIKIFSVVAVAFLPPTLVASSYGMNFVHMPELEWGFGYPMALGLMVLSAAVPLWFFRRRGWL
ncbi:magnesium transporter CorA family protein [Roseovarius nitratireducens]|uniref:magnesium transporter CorA family protein n=1 Tax=Roseovarius nitratireducens TaxID=2044597 RepID=UPI000CE287C0|nr:magnesium transporter CorA family protein [Roseovarius nitratireducens]